MDTSQADETLRNEYNTLLAQVKKLERECNRLRLENLKLLNRHRNRKKAL